MQNRLSALVTNGHFRRAINVIAALVFAYVVHQAHAFFMSRTTEGLAALPFFQPDANLYAVGALIIVAAALMLPVAITGVKSVFTTALTIVVFIPTSIITLCSASDWSRYLAPLLAFTAAFGLMAIVPARDPKGRAPGSQLLMLLTAIWCVSAAMLLYRYLPNLKFVGMTDTYVQRLVTAGTGGTLIGYVQTHFLFVVNPALIAFGLAVPRRWWAILLGLSGSILLYMIDAQKTALFLPFVVVAIFAVIRINSALLQSPALYMSTAAAAIWAGLQFPYSYYTATVVLRAITIPARTFTQYFEIFSQHGFTWWSHVRGLSLVSPGTPLSQHPKWPELGRIIGDLVYGDPLLNVNSNLFVSDGIAAGGTIGILVIGVAFATWLWLLCAAASKWNAAFVAAAVSPVAFALLNAPLFTTMLSFGGLFWIAVLSSRTVNALVSASRFAPQPGASLPPQEFPQSSS